MKKNLGGNAIIRKTNSKNPTKSSKNIIFRDMLESGSSFARDVLNRNLKYVRDIYKTRYLVPGDLTVSQFSFMNRKKGLKWKKRLFSFLANGKHSITGDTLLSEIYEKHRDPEDGFLYIIYTSIRLLNAKLKKAGFS